MRAESEAWQAVEPVRLALGKCVEGKLGIEQWRTPRVMKNVGNHL